MALRPRQLVVFHERRGYWARQMRPRLSDRRLRFRETRSAGELEAAMIGEPCPITVVDLGRRPELGLEDLARVRPVDPEALMLVVSGEARAGVATLAWELGASCVLSGVVTPPDVEAVLRRWIVLAEERSARAGWSKLDDADLADPATLLEYLA